MRRSDKKRVRLQLARVSVPPSTILLASRCIERSTPPIEATLSALRGAGWVIYDSSCGFYMTHVEQPEIFVSPMMT